ncbi:MAG: hypothetical protein PHE83_15760 [Opitutaceae bacterium]|nr:hypothetical protein [Opitutaceae bacterium]
MTGTNVRTVLEKLAALRTELVDLAYTLECRGQLDAADVAIMTSVRLGELCVEIEAESGRAQQAPGNQL